MMICPACGTQYSDDTLKFCLQDGSLLGSIHDSQAPTSVFSNTEQLTQVRSGGGQTPDPRFVESQVTRVGSLEPPVTPKSTSSSGKTALAIGATVVVMLVIFAIVGLGAFLIFRPSGNTNAANSPNKNANLANFFTVPTPGPSASSSITPTPTRAQSTPTPAATPVSTPKALSNYPSTTRLKFASGAYSTSYSGVVNPGDSRSLVLACRYGQTLSATLSGGGCVSFRSGGTSLRITTSGGDNYIYVANNCQQVTRFTVSISVL